jgi:hypothetical protein
VLVSDEDDAAYRRRITEVLERHGFGWVVQQAEAEFAEGKPVVKQVSEQERFFPDADPLFVVRMPRRRQANLITSEPYTEAERLNILLHAIEAALVERAQLERAILDELPHISGIEFQPETPIEEADLTYRGRAHRLDRAALATGRTIEEQAMRSLNAIKTRNRDSSGPTDR